MKTNEQKLQELLTANAFALLLAQLRGGLVLTRLAEEYPRLVEKVKLTGLKGGITLKLTVTPDGSGEVETVEVDAKVQVNSPEKKERPTVFYVASDHTLTRTDPKQTELALDRAEAPPAPAEPVSGIA